MFFKNIFVYKLNEEEKTEEELTNLLEEQRIVPCEDRDVKKEGWCPILPETDALTVKSSGSYFFCLKTEEKVIPNVVVKEKLLKRIKASEKETGEKLTKDDKEAIKESVIVEMAKKAFIKPDYLMGYIDYKNKLLVVDASSPSKADGFVSKLRETLGDLDLEIMDSEGDIVSKMTSWVSSGGCPAPFSLGDGCVLKNIGGEGSKIIASKQDLGSDEIKNHLTNGKMADQLDLQWHDRIKFKINSDFQIKGINFTDTVKEQISDELGESDDNYSKFVANMFMMVEDFNELMSDINTAFKQ